MTAITTLAEVTARFEVVTGHYGLLEAENAVDHGITAGRGDRRTKVPDLADRCDLRAD